MNLGAERVYEYELHSTDSRQFAVMFNILKSVGRATIDDFYAEYLHAYYFHNQTLVNKHIFTPAGFDDAQAANLYSHDTLGWNK
ncbi:unnamed protein product [Sphagnum balticum]